MYKPQKRDFCTTCIMPLITIGVLLWLLIKPSIPKCYIEEFDVFALRENTNSTHLNNTIYYNLKLKNRNTDKGVYYDTINLNFYYKPNEYTSLAIGNSTFTPFYQGKYKSTHRVGNIEPRGVRWGNATASTVMFRVELVTAVRYKQPLWKSKRHHLVVGADLSVNDEGSLGNGVRLRSNAQRNRKNRFQLVGLLGILFLVYSW